MMLKKLCLLITVAASVSACSSFYNDSAVAPDGGRFVSGQYDGSKAIFHCPSTPDAGDCERINVDFK
ncbi:hypothetical protein [Marinomonas aquiplantarum]|uniref:Lipoprotein n=1 Tax=Marinomonas aquiplantarum TaxID=491951 RepID=A0A366D1V5_9GAMM|nr:hypothetical protein [Marinomonas aquiplantarum]RBO83926.1 hypothetical protein DFP76_103200 [Marinomonas aquiplantarum]